MSRPSSLTLDIQRPSQGAPGGARAYVVRCVYEGKEAGPVEVELDKVLLGGVGGEVAEDGEPDAQRNGVSARSVDAPASPWMQYGQRLFDCFFKGEIRDLLNEARSRTSARGEELQIRVVTTLPEIDALAWETLTVPGQGSAPPTVLACERRTQIVRTPAVKKLNEDGPRKAPMRLRVLVVLASPQGIDRLKLAPLDLDKERKDIAAALLRARLHVGVEVRWLNPPTVEKLTEEMQRGAWDVLHFSGHGGIDQAGPYIVLGEGAPEFLYASDLARLARDQPRLSFALLNSCHGADGSGGHAATLARGLLDEKLAGVVAMQGSISDEAAKLFSRALYGALARGGSIERALGDARQTMLLRESGVRKAARRPEEWWRPAAYLRGDGRIPRPWLPRALLGVMAVVSLAGLAFAGVCLERSQRFHVDVRTVDGHAIQDAGVSLQEFPGTEVRTDANGQAWFDFRSREATVTVRAPESGGEDAEYRPLTSRKLERGDTVTMCWLEERVKGNASDSRCYVKPGDIFTFWFSDYQPGQLHWKLDVGPDMDKEADWKSVTASDIEKEALKLRLDFPSDAPGPHRWALHVSGDDQNVFRWYIRQGGRTCEGPLSGKGGPAIITLLPTRACEDCTRGGVCNDDPREGRGSSH